ncbi:MAG: hypothetical protein RL076_457 [Chloroflexota bacterium]|jgi:putative FmdB family regulatory protein
MPIYEYECAQCQGQFQRLVRGFQDPTDLACPRCHATVVTRRMSRVSQRRSDVQSLPLRFDAHTAPADDADPRTISAWAKQLGQALGADAGEHWNDTVEQMIDDEFSSSPPTRPADDLGWA